MARLRHLLKEGVVREHLARVGALLPEDCGVAVYGEGRHWATWGEGGTGLLPGGSGVERIPLELEGEAVGELLWRAAGDRERVAAGAALLAHALQALMAAEHARRAVAAETLESYREMALLQRASQELNRSLEPAQVARTLLQEFTFHPGGGQWGAFFQWDHEAGGYRLLVTRGEGAEELFTAFLGTPMFRMVAAREVTGILNHLRDHPLCAMPVAGFQSLLALPLQAHGEQVGLLVLAGSEPEQYRSADRKRAEALASVAAVALRNAQLYAAEKSMFRAFVGVISAAIDAKSPYTAGHCRRVPRIAEMLARAADEAQEEPFAGFTMGPDDWYALEIATHMHDCGKMVTPEWVVDKATKLEAIVDRLRLVELRIALLKEEGRRARNEELGRPGCDAALVEEAFRERMAHWDEALAFLRHCNAGGEYLTPDKAGRLQELARITWRDAAGVERPLLEPDELENLLVARGTLNHRERRIIEDHAVHTITMLEQIPFPPGLRRVPEFAGAHHERLDGSGYPHGLTAGQLSIPARIVAIADIFEALTAPDRPYRPPMTLDRALGVMQGMARDRHIDPDLFRLMLERGIPARYAGEYLNPEQVDGVAPAPLSGRTG